MPATLKLPEIYKIADKAIPAILKGDNSITNAIRLNNKLRSPFIDNALATNERNLKYLKSLPVVRK